MGWRKTTLSILSGQTSSEELDLQDEGARRKKTITFISPATLTGVCKIYLAEGLGGTYGALNDGFGNDCVLIAGKSQTQGGIVAGALKIVSSLPEGADRTFVIRGLVDTGGR